MADELVARPRPPFLVAISECLLGRAVRYDGSSARSSFPHTVFEGLFEFRGICPEVAIGMGIPRSPVRIVGSPEDCRVVGVDDSSFDVTDPLTAFGRSTAASLTDVVGYVFMQNSPSCGLFRVKVYPVTARGQVTGAPAPKGRGAHAAAVVEAVPELPVEENGRLNDPVLRENFVTRIYAYAHWRACFADVQKLSAAALVAFHGRYKYLLMAHSVPSYREAGRLLSDLREDVPGKAGRYIALLMRGLACPAGAKGHANVLSHLQGYLKKRLDSAARQELDALIQAYRRGEQPLLAPLILLQHHLRRYPDDYVLHQTYLDPHPGFPGLRRAL